MVALLQRDLGCGATTYNGCQRRQLAPVGVVCSLVCHAAVRVFSYADMCALVLQGSDGSVAGSAVQHCKSVVSRRQGDVVRDACLYC